MYGEVTDRIASANQLTAGVTSRFMTVNWLNVLIFLLVKSISLSVLKQVHRMKLSIAKMKPDLCLWYGRGDAYWRITDTLGMRGGFTI